MKSQKFEIYSLIALGSIFIGNVAYSEGESNLYLKTGIGIISGYHKFEPKINGQEQKLSNGSSDSPEYELGLEFTKDFNENVEFGVGLAYQFNSKVKKYNSSKMGKYNSLPLYVLGKYKFDSSDSGVTPYLKANLGYSFNINEKDGYGNFNGINKKYKVNAENGVYIGLGAGIEYNNFIVDLMYQVASSKASISGDGIKSDKDFFNSGKVTLGVGYKFSY